jgi:hypothetical protein
MIDAIRQLDRLLRGEVTSVTALREKKLEIPVVGLAAVLSILGMIYGACMGSFSLTSHGSQQNMQILASTVKVPALFVMTLIVTFPSLYVFNALFGSRLRLGMMLKLMVGALAVTMAILSSIGPIVAFFSVSSTSYAFIVLLNVVVFAVAGLMGLGYLMQTLHRIEIAELPPLPPPPAAPPPIEPTAGEAPAPYASDHTVHSPIVYPDQRLASPSTKLVFRVWIIVFGLVGAQMAWLLRPFIGAPNKSFTWFRPLGGNFFESVWGQIHKLFGW